MSNLLALSHKIEDFSRVRVLCLGDVMLDRFVYGEADRLSPEAPIPVLKIQREQLMPGGAGNLVRNVATLGATGTLVALVGEDDAANTLRQKIAEQSGFEARLVPCPDRTTTVKTRYVVSGQQLLRADVEDTAPAEGEIAKRVLAAYEAELERSDVVILSDYAKGLLSDTVLRRAIALAGKRGVPVVADPKSRDLARYRGVTVLLPNASELTAATDMPCTDDEQVCAAADAARRDCGLENILVTRSGQGMSLVSADGDVLHLPARAREVHDVSGAGDTVAATVAVALAAGLALEDAARLANVAAGLVVAKVGTATVYPEDLITAIQTADVISVQGEIVTLARALERVENWRTKGLKVGFTNGCFDLLHPGHVSLLREARATCDRLIVGLNTDDSVRRLKGPERPIQNETARSIVLASLGAVDLVVLFDEDTPIELIEAIKPDVLVKGAHYNKDEVVGGDVVTAYGGKVILAKIRDGYSTTRTLARVGANKLGNTTRNVRRDH